MKASVIYRALRALVAAKQPVFIWGGHGIGKSAIVRHLAADSALPIQDVRALLLDPVDLRGLPFLGQDGRSKWATPEFLPQGGSGILFLDELNAAPAMVQAGCYQLVLDRKLGEYTLPEGWAIIAAGNRDSDRAVTTRMPTPLRNRFVHLEFEVDLQDWSSGPLSLAFGRRSLHFSGSGRSCSAPSTETRTRFHHRDPGSSSPAFLTPRQISLSSTSCLPER